MSSDAPHLLHVFATFTAAGPQVRTAALLNHFGDAYRHTVLSLDGRTDAAERVERGVPLRLLEDRPPRGTLAAVRFFRALLERESPDLLLTYNWGATEAALAARTRGLSRHLHHEDGFRPDEVEGLKARRNVFRRVALGRVHGLIVPSRVLLELARRHWGAVGRRAHLVPNGIPVDAFPPRDGHPELRARLGIPPDAFVVGAVGHLRPEKNPRRLVAALAEAATPPDVHLLLLGDGPERAGVEEDAARAGLAARVHLAGFQDDPRPHYRAMDAFALPSDTEQMPVALLEAMACALPVAATDVGDVRAILPSEQGAEIVAAGPRAAVELAGALARLHADPARRAALGARNRERVREAYSHERMCGAYRELYEAARRA